MRQETRGAGTHLILSCKDYFHGGWMPLWADIYMCMPSSSGEGWLGSGQTSTEEKLAAMPGANGYGTCVGSGGLVGWAEMWWTGPEVPETETDDG